MYTVFTLARLTCNKNIQFMNTNVEIRGMEDMSNTYCVL